MQLHLGVDEVIPRVAEWQRHILHRRQSRAHCVETIDATLRRRIKVGHIEQKEFEVALRVQPNPTIQGRTLQREKLLEHAIHVASFLS